MILGNYKRRLLSAGYWFGILYAIAACINMREELLAIHATFPAMKSALLSSVTSASRIFLG
jgi:hypothetical protein